MAEAADVIKTLYEGLRPNPDAATPVGLLDAGDVAAALLEIPDDELVGSTDADEVRSALSRALRRVAVRRGMHAGLVGAGVDSRGGRLVLGAVRRAIAATDLEAVARNIRQAHDPETAERTLAGSLVRLDRAACAELESAPPNVWDAFILPSSTASAVWLLGRDPYSRPLFWNQHAQQFEAEPRAKCDRDWMVSNLTQALGPAWRKQKAGTFDSLAAAGAWARARPGQGRDGDLFVVDPDEDEGG